MPDRWEEVQKIFKSIDAPAQFVTYNGTRHTVRPEIEDDIVRFFAKNSGDGIVAIIPHEYPFEERKIIKELHINWLTWQSDGALPEFARHKDPGRIFIGVKEWNNQQNHTQLDDFVRNAGFHFRLTAKGQNEIVLTKNNRSGTVSSGDGGFQGYIATLTSEQLAAMKPDQEYHLEVLGNQGEYKWTIEGMPNLKMKLGQFE
jgi:hypothetical protein